MASMTQVCQPILKVSSLVDSYRTTDKRIFLFDYDGTLTPIVNEPAAAIPSDRLLTALGQLCKDPKNSVWIISGRDQDFLNQHFDSFKNLGLSAEHGCFVRKPENSDWECLSNSTDLAWQADIEAVFQDFTDKTEGSWIERKKVALTWHYRNAEVALGELQAYECRKTLADTTKGRQDIEVISGKCNVEVRPKDISKGKIIERLVTTTSPESESDKFILCLGDDNTDEDMFHALSKSSLNQDHVFTCRVGTEFINTAAKTYLPSPDEVVSLLVTLSELCN